MNNIGSINEPIHSETLTLRRWSEVIASWEEEQPGWTAEDIYRMWTTEYCLSFLDEANGSPLSFMRSIPIGKVTSTGAEAYIISNFRFSTKIKEDDQTTHAILLTRKAILASPNSLFVFAPSAPYEHVVARLNGFVLAILSGEETYLRYLPLVPLLPSYWKPERGILLRPVDLESVQDETSPNP